jgi:hypothetical protein
MKTLTISKILSETFIKQSAAFRKLHIILEFFRKPSVILKAVPRAGFNMFIVQWRELTNEREGRPEQKFWFGFRKIC